MVAMKLPFVMAMHQKNGRVRLHVEVGAVGESSLQIHYLPRGLLRKVDIIDAEGNFFPSVRAEVTGIDWPTYRHGLLGPVVLVLNLVLLSVMVKVKFSASQEPVQLSLAELKQKISEAVLGNPGFYTYAPPDEIVQRVDRARTIAGLIRSIVKD